MRYPLLARAAYLERFLVAVFAAALLVACGQSGTSIGPAPQAPGATNSPGGTSSPPVVGASPTPSAIATGRATSAPQPSPSASATPGGPTQSPIATPSATPTSTGGGGPLCLPLAPAAALAPPQPVRFGIDTGAAGNLAPVATSTPKPVNTALEEAALSGLRPPHGSLVVRLNRLFWSGGEALLQQFASDAQRYAALGYDVEVQVRYHPATVDIDNLAGWVIYVRHVVDVLGPNDHLVALTITNEVNFNVSPNTSDGAYPGAQDALIQGIEAAADEARLRGYGQRIRMGFTFAYRFNPATDAELFDYIALNGGASFQHALGFVGLDDYPGTVYPPAFPPGDTAGNEMADAIATMRGCYLPLGNIASTVPLWVTENGSSSSSSEGSQQAALTGMIDAVRRLSGAYGVTDYRWFNLRDNDSSGTGTFDQVGLLRDDYSAKPSYSSFQHEIAIGS